MDFLKIIQLRPGPSDAELEAERDRKHHAEVEKWLDENPWAGQP